MYAVVLAICRLVFPKAVLYGTSDGGGTLGRSTGGGVSEGKGSGQKVSELTEIKVWGEGGNYDS